MRKSLMAMAVGGVVAAGAAIGVVGLSDAKTARSEAVVVWKSPLCGCCGGWVDYMKAEGWRVTVHETDDMDAVKAKMGVPEDAWSCHTAKIGAYVVEGHVPVAAIDKLLAEKPAVAGIASPGMPQGSPGMSGAKEPNRIVAFTTTGAITPFGVY